MSKVNLVWNTYIGDWNTKQIEHWNVFDHGRFLDDCRKNYRKYGRGKDADREKFLEEVRRDLMYYSWSKCEWEVIVSHWPPNERFKASKIDVYEQVHMNWARFADYLWENRKELGKRVDS